MNVNQLAVLLSEREHYVEGFYTILTGKFVVRYATHGVCPRFEGALKQFRSTRVAKYAVLRKGYKLNVYEGRHGFLELQQCSKSSQVRVTDVNMRPYVQDPVRDLPHDSGSRTLQHVLLSKKCFAFGPALNTLKQGSALVPSRLTCRHCSIEVHM